MFFKGLITVLAVDALMVALSIPLILRKVPRNVVYGFRTLATLSDDHVWFEANAYFGRRLIAFSLVSAAAVLVIYSGQVVPQEFFVPATIVVMAFPPLIATVQTLRFMRSLKPKPSGTPPANTPQ
ncbi:MAG TPA: SdpI family protein [Thermoanaerobaculaceae bacterium]|nr:SdpI family protein [Thermoanaerobaculaceae bacterium]